MTEFIRELSFDGGETTEPVTVDITGPDMCWATIRPPAPDDLELRVAHNGEDITAQIEETDMSEIRRECLERINRERRENGLET